MCEVVFDMIERTWRHGALRANPIARLLYCTPTQLAHVDRKIPLSGFDREPPWLRPTARDDYAHGPGDLFRRPHWLPRNLNRHTLEWRDAQPRLHLPTLLRLPHSITLAGRKSPSFNLNLLEWII